MQSARVDLLCTKVQYRQRRSPRANVAKYLYPRASRFLLKAHLQALQGFLQLFLNYFRQIAMFLLYKLIFNVIGYHAESDFDSTL